MRRNTLDNGRDRTARERGPRNLARAWSEVLLASLTAAACLAYIFRSFFLSGGDMFTGSPADSRLCMILLEHWWAVCRGLASFRDANYFYPARDVLGYSHTLLLFAPVYIPFRLLNLDTYFAFELTLMVFKALGFAFCYAMLRATFRLSLAASLLGASLFTISNVSVLWSGHPQMWIVSFVPLLALLLDFYFRRASRAALCGAAFLFGAIMFSEFYTAFFCSLASAAIAACWAGVEAWTGRGEFMARLRRWLRRAPGDLLTSVPYFLVWFILLVWVYYPVLRWTGGRGYSDAYQYIRDWREFADIGIYNWMWGPSLGAFYSRHFPKTNEARMGLPVLMLLTVALATVVSLIQIRRGRKTSNPAPGAAPRGIAILGLASAALYLATVRFGTHTFWWVIYRVVPGARGLRIPGRINFLLSLIAATVCAIAFESLLARRRRRWVRWFAAALAAALIADQVSVYELSWVSRFSELKYFGRFPAAPQGCLAFYAIRPRVPQLFDIGQVDAMILARLRNIPTINAYGGWPPPGWDLYHFDAGYSNRAARYFMAHDLWDGACAADMEVGRWLTPAETRADLARTFPRTGLGHLEFKAGGAGNQCAVSGWSDPEAIGTWTDARHAILVVGGLSPERGPLRIRAHAMAFLAGTHRDVKIVVRVNGHAAGAWEFTEEGIVVLREAEAPATFLGPELTRIGFDIDDPRSPLELGVSQDPRRLGMLLVDLALTQDQ